MGQAARLKELLALQRQGRIVVAKEAHDSNSGSEIGKIEVEKIVLQDLVDSTLTELFNEAIEDNKDDSDNNNNNN